MDKKEIYEHLAKIYLDASLSKKKKTKKYPNFKNINFLVIAGIFVIGIAVFFGISRTNHNKIKSQFALVLNPDVVKINFNFDPARKEIYSLDLNRLNLMKYKALTFSVKKSNYLDRISLRIEFTNAFRERSEIYLKDLATNWQEQEIALADFKNISDWSEMANIAFIVEEWNSKEKRGFVYLDNIRFLR